eukprot:2398169-Amphidinium_carterae.1
MDPFKLLGLPLAQPWETGWGSAVSNPSVASPGDVVSASVLIAAEQKELGSFVARYPAPADEPIDVDDGAAGSRPVEMAVAMDVDRDALLCELLEWLLNSQSWSQLGQQLSSAVESERMHILADSFAERATGTLRQRVTSLRLFGKWKGSVVPYSEQDCYDYVRHLRSISAPSTRGRTFIGSATLLAAVANAACLDDIVKSSRLRGCAFSQLQHGKMREQRDPLTVTQ